MNIDQRYVQNNQILYSFRDVDHGGVILSVFPDYGLVRKNDGKEDKKELDT